jgi:RNA methyltransferase, TrmH family
MHGKYDDFMPVTRRPPHGLEITSPANARVKHLAALRRRRAREQAGVTVVEGYDELGLALSAGTRPEAVYYCPELADGDPRGIASQAAGLGAEVVRVSRAVFGKIAYRESPGGWLAVVPAIPAALADLTLGDPALILICEGVEKPGNLGAILRTADAAGVDAVIAAGPATDWGNPNVVRASKGTVFCVPVASATPGETQHWVAERRLALVATAPDAAVPLTGADLTRPVALAMGSESRGLPAEWLARADVTVRIPMFGRADSLNVAAAAAVVTYEALRQRIAAGLMPART